MRPRRASASFVRAVAVVAALVGVSAVPVASALAQSAPPEAALVSVGVQVGSLGGLSLRLPARTPRSWTVSLAFDGDGRAVAGAARHIEMRLPRSPLHLFAAPGVFVGTDDGAATAGVNTATGFGFYRARFDVSLAAIPSLALAGAGRRARIDAGIGVRYAL